MMLGTDPYSSTTSALDLLTDFTNVNAPRDTFGDYDLFHLFTGRELDGPTAGIAWVGSVCLASVNSGLSQHYSSAAVRAVLLAHEVGQ